MKRDAPPEMTTETTIKLPHIAQAQAARAVIQTLTLQGHEAVLVGGCVRDLVLGLTPKDFDVATSATPKQVLATFDRVVEVGVSFGVVRVLSPVDQRLIETEVATYRADGPYVDGRRPETVRFTNLREDVLRRDFTLNGLAAAQGARGEWEVMDFVGGLVDLREGTLRAIGQPTERFEEDALRLLRAVRFAARFNLCVDERTQDAIISHRERLRAVSRERIQQELVAMLCHPTADAAVKMLARFGLVDLMWPVVADADPGLSRMSSRLERMHRRSGPPAERHDPHNLKALDVSVPLALAVFFDDARLPSGELPLALASTLRLSNHDHRQLHIIWNLRDELAELAEADADLSAPRAPVIRALRGPGADDALRLLWARTDDDSSPVAQWCRRAGAARVAADMAQWEPDPWVDGRALVQMGFAPGPAFRAALRAAEDVQLEGGSRPQALAAARSALAYGQSAPDVDEPAV